MILTLAKCDAVEWFHSWFFFPVFISEGPNRPLDADCAERGMFLLREALGVDAIKLEVVPAWANPNAKRFHIRAAATVPGMLQ